MNEPTENVGTRLVFENERVRVWDLALEPGESLAEHIHRHDYLFYVIEGGNLRQSDSDNPESGKDLHFPKDQVVFLEAGEGLVHGRLTNVGTTPYRNLVIELK